MASINQRTELPGAAAATGVTALGVGGYELLHKPGRSDSSTSGGNKPNILVIVVDQMRAPQWFPEPAKLNALLPNVARLQRNSVSFESNIPTSAPSHIVAVRTRDAKLATYSYWKPGGMDADTTRPTEREFYDYSTPSGRHEIDNQAGRSPEEAALQALIDHQVMAEVRAPLPPRMSTAQEQGLADMRHLVALRGG
jgi:hypothetical protein